MHSWRSIALLTLIALAVIAGMTKPGISGAGLLVNKYGDDMRNILSSTGVSVSDRKTMSKTVDAHGVSKVSISISQGDLTVVRASDDKIRVEAELVAQGATLEEARSRLDAMSVDVRTEDGVVTVEGSMPRTADGSNNPIKTVVRVPSRIAVDAGLSLGVMTLEGIDGGVHAVVDLGRIDARRISGKMDLSVSAGELRVRDAAPDGELALSTSMGSVDYRGSLTTSNRINVSSGSVNMVVPKTTCVAINASTGAGRIGGGMPITGVDKSGSAATADGLLGKGSPTGELTIDVGMGAIYINGE